MPTTTRPTVEFRIAAASTRGFPVVTRARLRAAGVSRRRVSERLDAGSMMRLWDDTFVLGVHDEHDLSRDLLCRAAVATVEPAALAGVTAIERHAGWHRFDECIHVISERFHRPVPRWGIEFRRTRPSLDDVSVLDVRGIPTSSPVDALLQAARDLTPHQAANAIRHLTYATSMHLGELEDALERPRRVLGTPVLRRAIELVGARSAGTKSRSEDRLLPHVTRRFGEPLVNVRGAAGITDYEPDMCWWHARCIVEVDGGHHLDDPAIATADLERDALLRSMGWVVVRIHWRRVWSDLPSVLAEIERAFAGRPGFDVR